jgi:hypothetical protein
MVNAAMVNADPHVSHAPVSAEIFPFWAGFYTSKIPLNMRATRMLTGFELYTERDYYVQSIGCGINWIEIDLCYIV